MSGTSIIAKFSMSMKVLGRFAKNWFGKKNLVAVQSCLGVVFLHRVGSVHRQTFLSAQTASQGYDQ